MQVKHRLQLIQYSVEFDRADDCKLPLEAREFTSDPNNYGPTHFVCLWLITKCQQ